LEENEPFQAPFTDKKPPMTEFLFHNGASRPIFAMKLKIKEKWHRQKNCTEQSITK